jgi:hypothetical protein
MKALFLTIMVFLLSNLSSYAQFYMGIHYNLMQTQTFNWQTGASFDYQTSNEQGIQFAYHFARNKKKYDICYSISTGLSTYQRSARIANNEYTIDFIDISSFWSVNIPRTIEGLPFPLFDIILASGYHFGMPQRSNYTNDASATAFMNHGVLSNMGVAFYSNRGAKLELSYATCLDLGTNNQSNNGFTPYKFITKGFKVGFSVPIHKTLFQKGGLRKLRDPQ